MANRYFTSQFQYTFERQLVNLLGSVTQSGATGSYATLTDNGITFTADTMGSAGNDITIEIVDGGTAGSEVVTVTGTAISIEIEDGVSTRTQVKTALDASTAAAALIDTSVTSGGTAASLLAETNLAGGADTEFTQVGKGFSMSQPETGIFEITLEDKYANLLSFNATYMDAAGNTTQQTFLQSEDVSDTKKIRFSITGDADMADGDTVFFDMKFRNSADAS